MILNRFCASVTIVALLMLLTLACQQITESSATDSGEDAHFEEVELIKGPVSADGLQAIFATPDLGIGEQRVAVVLTSEEGLVRSPIATLTSYYYADGATEGEMRDSSVALFRPFPLGTRGLYAAPMQFDVAGDWGLDIAVLDENANTLRAELRFKVAGQTQAPANGTLAKASDSKTLATHDIADLTTGTLQDTDLYQISIADAVESGMPTVIVMASPAFCTNAVCGPQVDVLSELKDKYAGKAHFIHVDFFDNPTEIQGDLTRARVSPTVLEWNLPSTEWSFVVNSEGIVHQRFEGFAPIEELEDSLLEVLG
ncbi:MAG: hypothetical protein OXH22_08585 [Chloroflexi bacterium]|nr:hypothetical protein [Chloroflexota bacterium]